MFTLEFVCKRNAERSPIAHAVADAYVKREGLDGALCVTSSGVLAQEHPSPWGRLEHAVVNHFRDPALERYGLRHEEHPRLTRAREDVDLVLAFEGWIADRCGQRYAPLPVPPRVETVASYARMEVPSIRGIRKYKRYCALIEAMDAAMPDLVRRLLQDYPHRF